MVIIIDICDPDQEMYDDGVDMARSCSIICNMEYLLPSDIARDVLDDKCAEECSDYLDCFRGATESYRTSHSFNDRPMPEQSSGSMVMIVGVSTAVLCAIIVMTTVIIVYRSCRRTEQCNLFKPMKDASCHDTDICDITSINATSSSTYYQEDCSFSSTRSVRAIVREDYSGLSLRPMVSVDGISCINPDSTHTAPSQGLVAPESTHRPHISTRHDDGLTTTNATSATSFQYLSNGHATVVSSTPATYSDTYAEPEASVDVTDAPQIDVHIQTHSMSVGSSLPEVSSFQPFTGSTYTSDSDTDVPSLRVWQEIPTEIIHQLQRLPSVYDAELVQRHMIISVVGSSVGAARGAINSETELKDDDYLIRLILQRQSAYRPIMRGRGE